MPPTIDRTEGRRLFGADPALYRAARPEYPERVYEVLAARCGPLATKRVFEVGPGPGQVTLRLLQAGASVSAIEPDAALAEHLHTAAAQADFEVDIHAASFEDAQLPAASFDLGVAATSFHWVEQAAGLRKAHSLLVPGGWWTMWWNHFHDPARRDAFQEATTPLMRPLARSPTMGEQGRPAFVLDVEARTHDLLRAGFEDVEFEVIPWTISLDVAQIRALYSTFSPLARLPADERERILDGLAQIAEESFGGRVERAFLTALYTSRRP